MSAFKIDINADLGEGIGNDELLMPLLSSCNIACGGHAGNEISMRMVLGLAKKHKVNIGAHPSFPDPENFGRKVMEMEAEALINSLTDQILALKDIADELDLQINHIKPHGALYNLIAVDKNAAITVIQAIEKLDFKTKLYAPYNSVIARLATENNIEVVFEAFADRNYNDDLTLVSRKKDNAIIHKEEEVLSHILEMVKKQKVTSVNGRKLDIKASTFCVHGDTKNAVEILKYLNEELPKRRVEIE
ncbi:5-oxoprolinase subunit PxpA [Winogradskyella alexanderae]|uniref:5-oxoprolinase subunit PxpA n=1 Tax=Winogradskyella alexanderae TaxID=2877123 RepID=A0ABS7XT48_9FLAO|nr:5-oxoprolinase subunit PxpA [Winogradskyella alexanderae]MCA0133180.1 5-oxoprolinase subunit PxpA [Winogradskyella alexanderae]